MILSIRQLYHATEDQLLVDPSMRVKPKRSLRTVLQVRIQVCALTHITSAAESLWYLSGLDRVWYPMAKLVHQDSKSLDRVEL